MSKNLLFIYSDEQTIKTFIIPGFQRHAALIIENNV